MSRREVRYGARGGKELMIVTGETLFARLSSLPRIFSTIQTFLSAFAETFSPDFARASDRGSTSTATSSRLATLFYFDPQRKFLSSPTSSGGR